LKQKGSAKSLIILYLLSTTGIALFYSPGLFWGMRSHLSVVEYWRWWVVHLWVEGYFRSFCDCRDRVLVCEAWRDSRGERGQSLAAFRRDLFDWRHHRLHFIIFTLPARRQSRWRSDLFSAPSRLFRCCWSATKQLRTFVVRRPGRGLAQYKWVVYFFVAVAFWNLVGAGHLRIHDQSAHRSLLHAGSEHDGRCTRTARSMGVYGTLGLGLMLFCLRAMRPDVIWKHRPIWLAFWAINIGLMLEILLSLLRSVCCKLINRSRLAIGRREALNFCKLTDANPALDANDRRHGVRSRARLRLYTSRSILMWRQRGARVAVRAEVAVETV
jgi:nitric oxide reductase subunit B